MTYLSKRLLASALHLIAISAAAFALTSLAPGDAFSESRFDPQMPRETVERMLGGIGPNRVSFAGALSEQRLAGYYAACDVFVWPAISEAYGMALLEAQASGLPAIAGNSAGVAGIVDSGTTGLLTPAGDDEAFARALSGLLAHPERRDGMRKAALDKTGEKHGLSRAARLLDGVLTKLTGPA